MGLAEADGLRLDFAAFGAAGFGVRGACPVIGFLELSMWLGHVFISYGFRCN